MFTISPGLAETVAVTIFPAYPGYPGYSASLPPLPPPPPSAVMVSGLWKVAGNVIAVSDV
jgi:hypothetical protein